jgi:hypothetical protein
MPKICDVIEQTGCDVGLACYWDNFGNYCASPGGVDHLQPCSEQHDCMAGYVCADYCFPACHGTCGGFCDEPSSLGAIGICYPAGP